MQRVLRLLVASGVVKKRDIGVAERDGLRARKDTGPGEWLRNTERNHNQEKEEKLPLTDDGMFVMECPSSTSAISFEPHMSCAYTQFKKIVLIDVGQSKRFGLLRERR